LEPTTTIELFAPTLESDIVSVRVEHVETTLLRLWDGAMYRIGIVNGIEIREWVLGSLKGTLVMTYAGPVVQVQERHRLRFKWKI
jgi:hypothetical protein